MLILGGIYENNESNETPNDKQRSFKAIFTL